MLFTMNSPIFYITELCFNSNAIIIFNSDEALENLLQLKTTANYNASLLL